jgi:LmbE family N-acetylglucosaminyl deacetylase
LRETEQTNAAKVVGVSDLYFLRYPDGSVESTLELRRDISRVIRTVRPQRVLTQSPERNYDRIYASHPDHLAVGDAAVAAVYPDSRNPFAHPALLDDEGLEPWSVPELWLMAGGDIPEHAREVIDITDNLDRKIAALRCHESQTADRDDLEELIRNWTAASAESAGLPSDRHAEIFRSVDTR